MSDCLIFVPHVDWDSIGSWGAVHLKGRSLHVGSILGLLSIIFGGTVMTCCMGISLVQRRSLMRIRLGNSGS